MGSPAILHVRRQDVVVDVWHGELTLFYANLQVSSPFEMLQGAFDHSEQKPGVTQVSVGDLRSLTLLTKTQTLLVAVPCGSKPEK